MGKCSSHPNAPTKFTRSAYTSTASPASMTCAVSQGKEALSSGVSVSRASTPRDLGPASTKQPRGVVMVRSLTQPAPGGGLEEEGASTHSPRPARPGQHEPPPFVWVAYH